MPPSTESTLAPFFCGACWGQWPSLRPRLKIGHQLVGDRAIFIGEAGRADFDLLQQALGGRGDFSESFLGAILRIELSPPR